MRTGIANLPLHYGRAPAWLFERMRNLARDITIVIVKEFGTKEFLRKISDPFWFQSFGCALSFDWHSSGLTTTVCGALKEGLREVQKDLGIFVAGGKGRVSRKTPEEIENISARYGLSNTSNNLIYASRLAAKVDNTALQDGYQLYHHSFIFTRNGDWSVVQQGMNTNNSWARRYHWLGSNVKDFVNEPHNAICCDHKGITLNMVAAESEKVREVSSKLSREKPEFLVKNIKKISSLRMSRDHQLFYASFSPKNLQRIFLKTYENHPENFEKLLAIRGVGPKTIRALSLLSELIYGAAPSFRDPAKFAFAHGGKDGVPYPVDRASYDNSINILQETINKSKIGDYEKLRALRRLTKP